MATRSKAGHAQNMTHEKGVVCRTDGETAFIMPLDIGPCEKCELCHKAADNTIMVRNRMHAQVGDTIFFDLDIEQINRQFIKFMGVALVLFLLAVFGGYFSGSLLRINPYLLSLLAGAAALITVRHFFHDRSAAMGKLPEITGILPVQSKKGEKNG
jgi:hypothetical protein